MTGNVTMKPFKPALLAGWDALSWVLAAGAFVLIAESHSDISIEYTGLRHGEKLHEVLLSDLEVAEPSSHERITRVVIEGMDPQIVEGMCPGTQTSLTADREHQTH